MENKSTKYKDIAESYPNMSDAGIIEILYSQKQILLQTLQLCLDVLNPEPNEETKEALIDAQEGIGVEEIKDTEKWLKTAISEGRVETKEFN